MYRKICFDEESEKFCKTFLRRSLISLLNRQTRGAQLLRVLGTEKYPDVQDSAQGPA